MNSKVQLFGQNLTLMTHTIWEKLRLHEKFKSCNLFLTASLFCILFLIGPHILSFVEMYKSIFHHLLVLDIRETLNSLIFDASVDKIKIITGI